MFDENLTFKEKIAYILGLNKNSKYVKDHMAYANLRSSFFIALIGTVIEIWMLVRYCQKYVLTGMCETVGEFLHYTKYYWILLINALVMLIYSHLVQKGKIKHNKKVSTSLIMVFVVINLYFGITQSMSDFSRGRMITCFLTMAIYAACLQIWKPYTIVIMQSGVAALFLYLINNYCFNKAGEQVIMNEGDTINYIVFIISMIMVAISIYFQRYREAIEAEKLAKAAETDLVTGLPNMNKFSDDAKKYLQENFGKGEELYYIYFNIENFRTYNDKMGYDKGNALISSLGKVVQKTFKDEPFARVSSDHFAVLTKSQDIEDKVQKIRDEFKELVSGDVYMNVKAGYYKPTSIDGDPRLEISNARYAAGLLRNHDDAFVKEYDEELAKKYRIRQYILNNLDKAIKEGYIKVYYQPVVWSDTKELCGCEALARWVDPEIGFLSPGDFIPILEECRQIHKLDRNMYEQVCANMHECIKSGLPVVPVSMNFSRLDFELMDPIAELEELVAKYDIPKEYLHVEITESSMSNDVEKLKDQIKEFHDRGYAVWLDDFGSGYSSLNVLKDYKFDLLKIDMMFLRNFSNNDMNAKKIIKSILDLAKDLNMMTLSEGVETEDAVNFLQEAGCGRLQGFYYGKPMEYADLIKKITDGEFTIAKNLI